MKLDSRIIDAIRSTLKIYDPDRKLTAEDLRDLKKLKLSNGSKGKSESDISLVGLGKLGMIEHLSLTGFNITDRELDEIASIKMLKTISLNDCTGAVIDLPNLERVSISGGGFEKVLFDKLPREFIIENYDGEDIFNYLDAYDSSSMDRLTLIECNVKSLDSIGELSGMKRLDLYGGTLPEESTSVLEGLSQDGVKIVKERQYKPALEDR